jgi:hypothetical protein
MTKREYEQVKRLSSAEYRIYKFGQKHGVQMAAQFASTFPYEHEYRMDDVILCKFNLRKGRPRKRKALSAMVRQAGSGGRAE